MNHDESIAKAEKALAEAKAAKRAQMENIMIPCTACGKGNRVGDMLVRIHEHYVDPHGCTGGDYWTWGTGSDRSFVCGQCETTNRLFGNHNPSSLYWLIKDFVKHDTVRDNRDGFAHAAKSVNCKF